MVIICKPEWLQSVQQWDPWLFGDSLCSCHLKLVTPLLAVVCWRWKTLLGNQIFPSHEVFVLLLRPNIRPRGQNQKNVEFWTLNYIFISFTAITSSPALLISFTDSSCLRSKSAACGPCFKMSGTEPQIAMNAARNPSWLRQTPHAA